MMYPTPPRASPTWPQSNSHRDAGNPSSPGETTGLLDLDRLELVNQIPTSRGMVWVVSSGASTKEVGQIVLHEYRPENLFLRVLNSLLKTSCLVAVEGADHATLFRVQPELSLISLEFRIYDAVGLELGRLRQLPTARGWIGLFDPYHQLQATAKWERPGQRLSLNATEKDYVYGTALRNGESAWTVDFATALRGHPLAKMRVLATLLTLILLLPQQDLHTPHEERSR